VDTVNLPPIDTVSATLPPPRLPALPWSALVTGPAGPADGRQTCITFLPSPLVTGLFGRIFGKGVGNGVAPCFTAHRHLAVRSAGQCATPGSPDRRGEVTGTDPAL